MIEIARSYSQKLNLGNYQVADFFCSAKCECEDNEAETKAKELYDFCKREVEKSIEDFKEQQIIEKQNEFKGGEIELPE
ncbi:MAG: hypothetical protein PHS34_08485 [Candidatus Omnitrophica bacterium]|nr:hypothetical protein [Candidatus Omnitrophota bacterium]